MTKSKEQWISAFREIGDSILADLEKTKKTRMIKHLKSIDVLKNIENKRLDVLKL